MGRPRKSDKHLPPCVYEKHGAFYHVKEGRWTRLGSDLSQALAEYARRFDNPKGGMPELVERVLAHIAPNLAKNTNSQYKIAGARIKEALGEFAPHQVLPRHVAAVKADMSSTPNMANRVLSLLRIVFAHAVEWQIVDSNPCIGILRHKEGKRGRYLTDTEFSAIYAEAPERLQVIMDILYLTAQRVGDVLRIRQSDIGEEGISFKQEKTDVKLTVRWTPEMRAAVARANSFGGNVVSMNLFRTRARGGKPPSYGVTKDQWNEAVVAAGISDAHIHDVRAKSLTDAKRQGKDAQALAGHSNEAMTERYIRLREGPIVEGPTFASKAKKTA
jgi:integrase